MKNKLKTKTKTYFGNHFCSFFAFIFVFVIVSFFIFVFVLVFVFAFVFLLFLQLSFLNFITAPLGHYMFFRKHVLQKRSKFTGDHLCRSVISIKLHSKHFWEYQTGLDDIKIKVVTMVLTSIMLVIIYGDWFYY